jgi:ABC-type transport system involved in multi-copper enzyme maturation permease subunit
MNTPAPLSLVRPPSPVAAWFELIWLSLQRQARMRQMVWVALGLLFVTVLFVGVNSYLTDWKLTNRRARPLPASYRSAMLELSQADAVLGRSEPATAVYFAMLGSAWAILENSSFQNFSQTVIFSIFLGFLLPLWTLSFATEALGHERENRTMIWLFTRPLPRWSIYLAKWISALPWCLGMNLIGFTIICAAGGKPGLRALGYYWPSVVWGTLAFAALFHLIAANFRRPAIIGLIYAFFFETLVADLPGDLKRMSLNYYVRSMMYDSVSGLNLNPESLTVYAPAEAWKARAVLIGVVVLLNLLGMILFSRKEFSEDV